VLSLTVAGLLAGGAAQAQVNASLVAADSSAQPGKAVTVALRLQHEPGWHTYWYNPGIGDATAIDWQLPAGWSAGEIDWPVPIAIHGEAGDITGHGYENTAYLPVTVTVPGNVKPGEQVTLKGKARWLMCSLETCVPGGADVQLTLPVSADAPKPNADVRAALGNTPMPRMVKDWKVKVSTDGKVITLKVAGAGNLNKPHFFPGSEIVSYDAEQGYSTAGNELTVTLPIDKYYEGEKNAITGLLTYTDASGQYVGVKIEAPMS
jgi:thiol:disulfide interchange protein DsbD